MWAPFLDWFEFHQSSRFEALTGLRAHIDGNEATTRLRFTTNSSTGGNQTKKVLQNVLSTRARYYRVTIIKTSKRNERGETTTTHS